MIKGSDFIECKGFDNKTIVDKLNEIGHYEALKLINGVKLDQHINDSEGKRGYMY